MRKKKIKKTGSSISEISRHMRGYLLDSQISNAHELAVILGCSVISDEVAIKEEEESDKRVDKVAHLIPLIYAFSHMMAEGATEYQRITLSSEESLKIQEEAWHESRKVLENASFSAVLGAISQLIDMGMLALPKKKRSR